MNIRCGSRVRHAKRGSEYDVIINSIGLWSKEPVYESHVLNVLWTGNRMFLVPMGHEMFCLLPTSPMFYATLQSSNGPVDDTTKMVIYRSVNEPNETWARPYEEFHDGRFELVYE